MCSAIHINYRSWLRSSSTHEPSDPPHRIVFSGFRKEEGATSHLLSRRLPLLGGGGTCDVASDAGPCKGAYTTPSTNRARGRHATGRFTGRLRRPEFNGRDERSCEDGHPRGPYTARRPFNPPERVSGPGQDAQLRIDPSLPSRTIAMS